jgi:mercuric ion transport protein
MEIQLLYFPDCPNVAAARNVLDLALKSYPEAPPIAEIDLTAPETPAHLRVWGSPTILIDGVDVAGEEPVVEGVNVDMPVAPCCRVYQGGVSRGAPLVVQIMFALERARQSRTA